MRVGNGFSQFAEIKGELMYHNCTSKNVYTLAHYTGFTWLYYS